MWRVVLEARVPFDQVLRMDLQDVDEVLAILDMQADYKTAQESFNEQQSKEKTS